MNQQVIMFRVAVIVKISLEQITSRIITQRKQTRIVLELWEQKCDWLLKLGTYNSAVKSVFMHSHLTPVSLSYPFFFLHFQIPQLWGRHK